jgi:CubicO group peptidase (beta-lactamase class C family)
VVLLVLFLVDLHLIPQTNDNYIYKIPPKLHDGWEVSSLKAVGIRTEKIEEITNRMLNVRKYAYVRSMLIVKNKKLVHEVYSPYHQRNTLHWLASITKTFTSTLIGIAIDKGYIKDINESVIKLLPEYSNAVKYSDFQKIKLKHLLCMTSGMDWNERSSYNDIENSEHIMVDTEDWMRYVLKRKIVNKPGTKFNYNTGGIHLLSAVIKSSTGLYANEFAEKYLLHPLGIYGYQWNRDPRGFPCTGGTDGGIGLRTRDLAKFGLLILNDGIWKGKQIVSKKWIKEATGNHKPGHSYWKGYGYNWFPGSRTVNGKTFNYIATFGYGGQFLYIIPKFEIIFALTSDLTDRNWAVNGLVDEMLSVLIK